MLNAIQLLPGAITDILVDVAKTNRLTLGDRYGLLAAVLNDDLPDEERRAVNRILWAVRRGQIQVMV